MPVYPRKMGLQQRPQIQDPADVGWVAGLIDGEGSVTLDRRGRWRRPGLSVASTDIEILNKLKCLIGGAISVAKLERKAHEGLNRKPRWNWKLSGARQALAVLQQILPHMACPKKIARARFVLEHYERLTPLNGLSYSEEHQAQKRAFESGFFELGAPSGS